MLSDREEVALRLFEQARVAFVENKRAEETKKDDVIGQMLWPFDNKTVPTRGVIETALGMADLFLTASRGEGWEDRTTSPTPTSSSASTSPRWPNSSRAPSAENGDVACTQCGNPATRRNSVEVDGKNWCLLCAGPDDSPRWLKAEEVTEPGWYWWGSENDRNIVIAEIGGTPLHIKVEENNLSLSSVMKPHHRLMRATQPQPPEDSP